MATPYWALSLVYWLHMLATVVWIGGLATLSLLVLPAAGKTLSAQAFADLLEALQKRLDPLGWFSLVLLTGTGLIQMSANSNYQGFLQIGNRWAAAILIKHLVFLVMIGISVYLTWWLMPNLRRAALRQARVQGDAHPGVEKFSPVVGSLQRREIFLLRLNLIMGVLILALTALARAS